MVDKIEDERRIDPDYSGPEREQLEQWLDYHRMTLPMKCDGLDDGQRKTAPIPTSVLSLHGLVRHMAEVERGWFRRGLGQEPITSGLYYTEDDPDGDFGVDGSDWETDLSTWREQCERAREVAASLDLDDSFYHQRHKTDVSLRWVYMHMIEEYARHNGHADLIREMIDGAVGD